MSDPLTAYHDPTTPDSVLVSVRDARGCRDFQRCGRPRATQLVRIATDTGERSLCDACPVPFEPGYGQRIGEHCYYPSPPPWRILSPVPLPCEPPAWLVEVLFFVWGDVRRLSVLYTQRTGALRFASPAAALDCACTQLGCDVLYVCTRLAAAEMQTLTRDVGLLERARRFPVVCHPDDFVRVTSLDRAADGSATWYRQPVFNPQPSDTFADGRLGEVCTALALHRHQWLAERRVLRMMFSLARITGLQLHEVSNPHQTALADAIIETTWMRAPLELDPPQPNVARDAAGENSAKFRGASVLDADCRLHYGTICMPDVSSLYPNVVREYLADRYPLYAHLFSVMIDERARESDPLHASALKLITNAVFGSRKHGRYPDRTLAELITEHGRLVQRESLDDLTRCFTADEDYAVLGGDTDALALWVSQHIATGRLVAVLNGRRRFALYKPVVDTFSVVFFVNNKSWAGLRADNGAIVTRGLMQNRSTTPAFVRPSHVEWIEMVLRQREFATSAQVQREWIQRRVEWLRGQPWSATELACYAKPTQDHPETDRATVHVVRSTEPVPLADYLTPGRRWPPIDVDYLLKIYFVDELERHVRRLELGPAIR